MKGRNERHSVNPHKVPHKNSWVGDIIMTLVCFTGFMITMLLIDAWMDTWKEEPAPEVETFEAFGMEWVAPDE